MHSQYLPPIANIRERPLLLIKQPIFYFLTTCTHAIYITEKQIRVLLLLGQIPVFTVTKIDTRNIVRVLADKNSRIAILYSNHKLEIRNANEIEKIRISYNNIVFCEEDVKRGFPKIYFKDDVVFLLTMNRLQMLSMKENDRKAYTDIFTEMHGKNNNIQSIAFSNLIKDEKVAVLHFKNKLAFTFIPISITEIETKHVTQIKMLSIAKFYDVDKYLPREYLVMVVDNTKLEVYNLVSMKKLIEIQYDTQIGSKIQLSSDYHQNFLLVTIYKPGHQVIKTMFLYRINAQYYYPPTADYFKEEQTFFDTSVELSIKHPIVLLNRNYQHVYSKLLTDGQPYPKCPSVTAIYYREAHKKTIKKKFKQLSPENQKILQIVLLQIDITKAQPFDEQLKSKQLNFNVKRQKKEWMELREWKEIILSYLEMKKSLELDDNSDYEEQDKFGEMIDEADDDFYLTDQKDKKIGNFRNSSTGTKNSISNEKKEDPYDKLRKGLEDANEFLCEEECEDEEASQAEFIKYLKEEIRDEHLSHCVDEFLQLNLKKSTSRKNDDKQIKKITNLENVQSKKDIKKMGEKYRPETQPQTPKEKQKMVKSIEQTNKNQKDKQLRTTKLKDSQLAVNQEQNDNINEKQKADQHESNYQIESDPNQLFDEMLEAIEVSINRGFSPLEKKLQSLEDKLDKYQEKQVQHLEKYSRSVQFECNYLNNIESSIHGYCFEMMGQLSETIQNGVQDYWQKIEDLDRAGKQERQRTIHQFGMFIDQQIKERQSIFDHNRMMTENSLGQLRKAISSHKQHPKQILEAGRKGQGRNPYINLDEDIDQMGSQMQETDDLRKDISYIEALAMLSSFLGNKGTHKS